MTKREQSDKELSEIEKAILVLYKIVGTNHITPDIVNTASFMLKGYEEQKRSDYIFHLQQQISELNDALLTAKQEGAERAVKYIEGCVLGLENLPLEDPNQDWVSFKIDSGLSWVEILEQAKTAYKNK